MYTINGISLDNETFEWQLLRGGTQAFSGIVKNLTKINVPGYDGYFRAPSTRTEQVLILNMKTSRAGMEPLLALVSAPTLSVRREDDSTREAIAELVSAIPSGQFPEDETMYLTVTLNVFGGAWRDVTATIAGPTTVTDPIQTINVLPGISAPVSDMDVFLSGVFGQFTLTDSGGSYIKSTATWPGSAGTGMLYVGSTKQFFTATTGAPWTPVSDVGHLVDVSGGGGFKITPENISNNPANRRGRLTLSTLTQTSSTIRVRAKNAYSMQSGA